MHFIQNCKNKFTFVLLLSGLMLSGCGGGGGGGAESAPGASPNASPGANPIADPGTDSGAIPGSGPDTNTAVSPSSLTVNVSSPSSAEPQNQVFNALIGFDGAVSGGKAPYSYRWDFGDGTTAQTKGVSHQFTNGGQYQVRLTVTDADGLTATNTLPWSASKLRVRYVSGDEGGAGRNEGISYKARFNLPGGVAVATDGTIYVADSFSNMVRKILPNGATSNFAGAAGLPGWDDGTGAEARFQAPHRIAMGPDGYVYITDFRRIRKISPAGQVSTVAGQATTANTQDGVDGPASLATFGAYSSGLVVDSRGAVFVLDGNTIRKIADGQVSTFVGKANESAVINGNASTARLKFPSAIAIDSDDNIYIYEKCIGVRKINPSATVSSFKSSGTYGGVLARTANCSNEAGLVINSAHQAFIATADAILSFDSQGTPFVYAGSVSGDDNGTLSTATFRNLEAISINPTGDLIVTGQASTVRKISTTGNVTNIAGLADKPDWLNPGNTPFGPAARVSAYGNGYSVATNGSCVQLLRFGNFVSELAGNCSTPGYFDGTGNNARFTKLTGIAVDSQKNVFVADSSRKIIRKINTLGEVSTYAGILDSTGSSDGVRTAAKFDYPTHLSIDGSDNLWVADNNGKSIRLITAAGEVKTIASSPSCNANTDSPPCFNIKDIAADKSGFIYITSSEGTSFNFNPVKILLIQQNGQITPFANSTTAPISIIGDGSRLAIDAQGDVWLSTSDIIPTGYPTLRHINAAGVLVDTIPLKSFTTQLYVNEPSIEFTRVIFGMAFNTDGSLMRIGGGSAFLATGF
jgi:hypothetical protein